MGALSTLDGVDCDYVHIEHGARVYIDEAQYERKVATIGLEFDPAAGQTLVHSRDGTFVLDRKLADNGVNARFILRAP